MKYIFFLLFTFMLSNPAFNQGYFMEVISGNSVAVVPDSQTITELEGIDIVKEKAIVKIKNPFIQSEPGMVYFTVNNQYYKL